MQAAARQRVRERGDDVSLADELAERAGPPFAREDLVTHEGRSRSICRRIALRLGASPRERRTYMEVRERSQRTSNEVSAGSGEQRDGVPSRSPGTCSQSLWLLPSGPDQVH